MPPKFTLETKMDIIKPTKRRSKAKELLSSGLTDNSGAKPDELGNSLPRMKRKVQVGTELRAPEHVQSNAKIQSEVSNNELIQSSDKLVSRAAQFSFIEEFKLTENKSPLAPTQKKVTCGSKVNMEKNQGLRVRQASITSFRHKMIKGEREGNSASDDNQNLKERQ